MDSFYSENRNADSARAVPSDSHPGIAARKALSGSWFPAAGTTVVLAALFFLGSRMLSLFARNASVAAGIMSFFVFVILILLLYLPVDGALYQFLLLVRGRKPVLQDMLFPIRSHPDRFLIAACVETAGILVFFSPQIVLGFLPKADILPGGFFLLLSLLPVIPSVFLWLNLSQTVFLLLDNPELEAVPAVKESIRLMRGKKKRLFMLFLPFIGYAALGILSFGIGFLWIIPYHMTLRAAFFEIEIHKKEEDSDPPPDEFSL